VVRADYSSRGVLPIVVCKTNFDRKFSIMGRPWSTGGCRAMVDKYMFILLD